MLVRAVLALLLVFVTAACQGAQSPPSTPTPALAAKPTAAVAPSPAPTVAVAAASPSPTRAPVAASSASAAPTSAAVPVTASRTDVLAAANAAFARGDIATAADFYQRVVNTAPSQGEAAELSTAIDSFARFRAMVALLSAGRESDARQQLEALAQRDPNAPFARLAAQLWDQYGMIGQLRAACIQLQPQVASQAGPTLVALQAAGVSVDPNTLCAPPQGGGY